MEAQQLGAVTAVVLSVFAGLAFVPNAAAHACYEASSSFPNCGGCGQTPQFEIHAHVRDTGLACVSAGFIDIGGLAAMDLEAFVQSLAQVILP